MRFASELKLEWVHLTGPSIGHRTARFCRSEILRHGVSLLLGSGNAARVFTPTVQGAAGYPYGTDISGQTAQFNPGTIDFATYLNDSSTGLEYANQRWCSAGYVRFVTADKSARSVDVENPQSWNRYWYAAGDPVNVNDPSGSDTTCGPGMVWDGEGCTIGEAGTTAQFCLDDPELCGSGSPPVNQCSAGEDGFDPAPDPAPGCIVRPPPTQTAPDTCDVSLYAQSAGPSWDPFVHTDLLLTAYDPNANVSQSIYLESGPVVFNDMANWNFQVFFGHSWNNEFLHPDLLYKNSQNLVYDFARSYSSSQLCTAINVLGGEFSVYKNFTTIYHPIYGPNSNSFASTFLRGANLTLPLLIEVAVEFYAVGWTAPLGQL